MAARIWIALVISSHLILCVDSGWFSKTDKEEKCPMMGQLCKARDDCLAQGMGNDDTMGQIFESFGKVYENPEDMEEMQRIAEDLVEKHQNFCICMTKELKIIDMETKTLDMDGIAALTGNAADLLSEDDLLDAMVFEVENCKNEATMPEMAACAMVSIDRYCQSNFFKELPDFHAMSGL